MSPDYRSYSLEELLDVLRNIDKANYSQNYLRLQDELIVRGYFTEPVPTAMPATGNNEQAAPVVPLQPRTAVTDSEPEFRMACSVKRILWVLSAGAFGSLPIVYMVGSSPRLGSDLFFLLLSTIIAGGALLHSFIYGWTLSKMGVIKLSEDPVSFTIAQVFFSYLTCLFLFLVIAGWFV